MASPLFSVLTNVAGQGFPAVNEMLGINNSSRGGGFMNSLGSALGNVANIETGGLFGVGMGALKNLQANRQQKQANAMFPGTEDPELRMLAGDYRRRRRAFQTGTANYAEMANQRAIAKQGINAAFQTGGNSAGLNRMNSMLGQAMLAGKGAGLQGEMAYTQLYDSTVNRLAQTRLEKALLRYNQAQANAAQTKTDANRMLYSGLARVLGTGNPYDVSTGNVANMSSPTQNYTGVNYGQNG